MTKREEIGRAIVASLVESHGFTPEESEPFKASVYYGNWIPFDFRKTVDAVLSVLREPTMDMEHAALEASRRADPALLPSCKELWASKLVWQAMIDEASK